MVQGWTVMVAVMLTVKLMQGLRLVLSVLLLELGLYLVIVVLLVFSELVQVLWGDGSTNINVVGAGMGSAGAPTAFQAWSKSCEDTLALQGGLYQWALTQQSQRFQDRQVIDSEMFGLYKSQIDADFLLYKGNRDNYDSLKAEISELKTQVAVSAAIRPYQDKLIQCEIERAFTAGINYVDKKTCNVIYGVTCLPNEPTTTGLVGRNANGCLPCGFTQTASTPAT